jgi:hypothetical protein
MASIVCRNDNVLLPKLCSFDSLLIYANSTKHLKYIDSVNLYVFVSNLGTTFIKIQSDFERHLNLSELDQDGYYIIPVQLSKIPELQIILSILREFKKNDPKFIAARVEVHERIKFTLRDLESNHIIELILSSIEEIKNEMIDLLDQFINKEIDRYELKIVIENLFSDTNIFNERSFFQEINETDDEEKKEKLFDSISSASGSHFLQFHDFIKNSISNEIFEKDHFNEIINQFGQIFYHLQAINVCNN